MTQSISDILADKHFEEPVEISQIKSFVQSKVGLTPSINVTQDMFIINIPSASAAGALRMHLNTLASQLETNKKLVIRIR